MKKISSLGRKITMLALSLVMIITTAVSFAYWKDTITGNDESSNLNIVIGQGEALETKVTINLARVTPAGKVLVPYGRDSGPNDVTEIVFNAKVFWDNTSALETSDPNAAGFEANNGILSVMLTDFRSLEGTTFTRYDEALQKTVIVDGSGNKPLFEVKISVPSGGAISGRTNADASVAAVEVVITIKMNDPLDREQYLLVAGKNMEIDFVFSITSSYDRNEVAPSP